VAALAAPLGGGRARELVDEAAWRAAATGRPLRDTLLEAPEVADHLGPAGVEAALDPARYLGSTQALIDRALAAHG
jgi:3-carboxy-cis,cis-muconate cycloisomerase